jgi:adenine-specific DNA-methyltransferase
MSPEELERLVTENTELRDEVIRLQSDLDLSNSKTKVGLTWEHLTEEVDKKLVDELPVLLHVPKNDVRGARPSEKAHLLIEGDNLHVLQTLQATHEGQVDLIYIDPPYNTGKEFIFNDKIIEADHSYRHSAWLSFMDKRLRLAKELMKESATMLISINQIELPRLWLLLESIFGEKNVEVMIWHKVSESGSAGQGKMKITHRFRNDSEFVVCVYKNRDLVRFNKPALAKNFKNQYPNVDNDLRGPWISSEICKSQEKSKATGKNYYTITSEAGTSFSRQWHVDEQEFRRLDADGRIYWGQGKTLPRLKKFVDEPQPTTPTSLIAGYSQTDGIRDLELLIGPNPFDNPKPVELVQFLIEVTAPSDAVILDFFAGSGTTLQAVAQANEHDDGNRQCILVTNNENNIVREVTLPRVVAALTGEWVDEENDPLPGSLAFYETGFLLRRKSIDRMRSDVAAHTVDFIAVKFGVIRRGNTSDDLAILFAPKLTVAVAPSLFSNHQELRKLAETSVRTGDRKIVYVFTWSEQGVEDEIAEIWDEWDVRPLPAQMLSALRRLAPQPTLENQLPEVE